MTYSIIQTINYIQEISNVIKNADNDTLILFDIDEVVLMDQDSYRLTHPIRKKIIVETKARISREEKLKFFSAIFKNRKIRYVDDNIVDIFKFLKANKLNIMALTKLYTGKFGLIDDFVEWRIKELASCNINFLELSPFKHELLANHMNHDHGGIPTLKDGIIFTADLEKGPVLEYFLTKLNYFPKKIIFIDDLISNIKSVEETCSKFNIEYHAFEFLGAKNIPEIELNEIIERKRFQIVEEESIWIENDDIVRSRI
jgi:hypothetical protein